MQAVRWGPPGETPGLPTPISGTARLTPQTLDGRIGVMADCINGHVDPPRYPYNNTCKLCTMQRAAEYRRAHPDKKRAREAKRARVKRREDRVAALTAYGGACACCGEKREPFLVLDHINGDGAEHRRAMQPNRGAHPPAGYRTYQWLRLRGYPPGLQVLCANCNMAKERGTCPHQTEGRPPDGHPASHS